MYLMHGEVYYAETASPLRCHSLDRSNVRVVIRLGIIYGLLSVRCQD